MSTFTLPIHPREVENMFPVYLSELVEHDEILKGLC